MKKQIKTIILFITIFSLYFGFRVWAAADPDTYTFELSSEGTGEIDRAGGAGFYGKIVSATPQGNYTLLIDDCGSEGLVNTSQWNEYQLMIQQGNPEVVLVDIGWSEGGYGEHFYVISCYQLAGQPEVKLPKESQIKIKDPFNCDHLSILKYLGNQLGSSYVFNQTKREQEIKDNNAKIAAEYAKERAKWAEMDKQVEQEKLQKEEAKKVTDRNSTTLPYNRDYIKNYKDSQVEISHQKVWASFDSERNYLQQWLDSHGFKSMQELKDYAYKTGVTHYGLQEQVAIQYCKYVEEGKCSTIGDYIRLKFKENAMAEWNQLEKWAPRKSDYGIWNEDSKIRFITCEDEYKINLEVCKMIEADMPIIASNTALNAEEKTAAVENLLNYLTEIYTPTYVKDIVKGYETRGELMHKTLNKWVTEYLTASDKEEMRKKGKDYWTEGQWKDYQLGE